MPRLFSLHSVHCIGVCRCATPQYYNKHEAKREGERRERGGWLRNKEKGDGAEPEARGGVAVLPDGIV